MSPVRLARLEEPLRIVLRFTEAFNRHDLAAMVRLVSEDCVLETPSPAPDGSLVRGRDAAARFWQDFFRDSPQARVTIEETLSAGLRCVIRWRRDRGDTAGEESYVRGVDLFRVKDGLICEKLSYVKGSIGASPGL